MVPKYMETGLDRLEAAIARQAVQDTYGIGDTAWDLLQDRLTQLHQATTADLGVYDDRREDGFGTVERPERTVDPGAERQRDSLRTAAQQVAAVMAPYGEDPALFMARAVGNPNLTVSDWRRILAPARNQPGVEALQTAARWMREGWTQAEVMEHLYLSSRQVERLSRYLGVVEWRRERELMFATDSLEEGLSLRDSWERWCQMVPTNLRPSLKTWRRRWVEAERILAAA